MMCQESPLLQHGEYVKEQAMLKSKSSMNVTELMAWACAPDSATAYTAWKTSFTRRNPELNVSGMDRAQLANLYYSESSIAQYWKSPLGQFNRDALRFWMALHAPLEPVWQRRLAIAFRIRKTVREELG